MDQEERTRPGQSQQQQQPTITEAFLKNKNYDHDSHEARKLDRAVAEFICMDKVPIYTVEKHGFQKILVLFFFTEGYTSLLIVLIKKCMLNYMGFFFSFFFYRGIEKNRVSWNFTGIGIDYYISDIVTSLIKCNLNFN